MHATKSSLFFSIFFFYSRFLLLFVCLFAVSLFVIVLFLLLVCLFFAKSEKTSGLQSGKTFMVMARRDLPRSQCLQVSAVSNLTFHSLTRRHDLSEKQWSIDLCTPNSDVPARIRLSKSTYTE